MQLSSRFSEALEYAAALHSSQRRKMSGTPYVSHLLGVAAIAIEYGASENEAMAALLHDAIEDQGGEEAEREIRRRFGDEIAEIVIGCTDSYAAVKAPWRQRKETYLARLSEASPSVRLVVACDKLHNARSLLSDYRRRGESLWDYFRGGRDGTLWYYRAVVEVLKQSGTARLVGELEYAVSELERMTAQPP